MSNEVCHRIWNRDMTVKRWAEVNGFGGQYVYTCRILSGKAGKRNLGFVRRVLDALVQQGLMSEEERNTRLNQQEVTK